MAPLVSRLVALAALVLSVLAAGRASAEPSIKVQEAPAPAWVEAWTGEIPRGTQASNGLALELYDEQTRFVGGQRWAFTRVAMRVTNELGVTDVGQRRFEFRPPYQHLVLHRLEVRRDGLVLPRLDKASIEVLRREVDLDENVEDGARTAVVVVPDVRVGDVVYYEYSVVGSNPVLGGHAMDWWLLGRSMAVGAARYRVVADHALQFRQFAGAPEPVSRRAGALYEYALSQDRVAAVHGDDNVPNDYDVAPWIQFSDFQSWAAVAAWGRDLFRLPARPSPAIQRAAREIVGDAPAGPEQVRRVIRAVEERIRYLSLALAESSHRPAAPEQVLSRRFGDCKDKALLATALLRALGFQADVALANPDGGDSPAAMLPTSSAFNHAIVLATVDGLRYWLDPTRLYQRGRLDDMAVHDSRYVLVLAPDTDDLTAVPTPSDVRPDVTFDQHYVFDRFGGPTTLEIRATYRHRRAETLRAAHASSPENFDKAMRAQVLEAHPHATPIGDPEFTDRERENEIDLVHRYKLDKEWSVDAAGRTAITVVPVGFMPRVTDAKPDRKLPLAVECPLHVEHDIRVDAPGTITVQDPPIDEIAGGMNFRFRAENAGPTLHLRYGLTDVSHSVEAGELPAYRALLEKMQGVAAISLWKVDTGVASSRFGWLEAADAGWAIVLVLLVIVYHRKQPWLRRPNVAWRPELAARRGWLALLGIGVTIAPLRAAYSLAQYLLPARRDGFLALMTPGSSAYHPWFGALLGFELWYLSTLLFLYAYTAYAYWGLKRSFPVTFVSAQLLSIVCGGADAALAVLVLGKSTKWPELLSAVPFQIPWILYVLHSARVRATFLPEPDAITPRRRKRRRKKQREVDAPPALPEPVEAAPEDVSTG